ncbi:unnamed protein product [Rotaria sordida]|uniref:Uncharacterized protein n=1 Tax=Rotaria sordida TaxID=392033 RepID=A0A814PQ11_9BILA|nr:unnamed protein product [Rotaria sordida]
MTDNKDIIRSYLQDRSTCQHSNTSTKTKKLREINMTFENDYTNRNDSIIIPLFTSKDGEKQLYRSISNDTHCFNVINYQIPHSQTTPILNLALENSTKKQDKQPMFPKLTPKLNTSVKTFPILTSRSISSSVDNKSSMPTIRTSLKSMPSSPTKIANDQYEKYIDFKKLIILFNAYWFGNITIK